MAENRCPKCQVPITEGADHDCADGSIQLPREDRADLTMMDAGPLRAKPKQPPTNCPECGEVLKEGVTHDCSSDIRLPAAGGTDATLLEASPLRSKPQAPQAPTLKCPACGESFSESTPHECGAAAVPPPVARVSEPTVTQSNVSRASSPPTVSARRKCPDCGQEFAGEFHDGCSHARTIMVGDPAAPSRRETPSNETADDTPADVRRLRDDPSKVVHQYVLVDVLGKGGMGTVYRAWDTKLTRFVALKFLSFDDAESIKRFEREARLAARLNHPNIAPIYEVGEHQGRHFMAMELIDGVPFNKADLPLRKILEAMVKVAQALQVAHQGGIIHRDLKPDNIMITKQGWPYIMDFGLAKATAAESGLSMTGDVMGTPAFMSPEQALGKIFQLDGRSDIYSLGATLYVLLTGQKPFAGANAAQLIMKVVQEEPVPMRKLKPDIPEPIEAIVMKAMEKEKERRYATAADFAADIERYLSNLEVVAERPSVATVMLRKMRRNPAPMLGGAAVLLALIAGLAIAGAIKAKTHPPPHNGTGPGPAPDPSRAWREEFQKAKDALDYKTFQPGDGELLAKTRALLSQTGTLPAEDVKEAIDWFNSQVSLVGAEVGTWSRDRGNWAKYKDPAVRRVAWCDAVTAALADAKAGFAEAAAGIPEIRRMAKEIGDYLGEFTLRLSIAPYGFIKDLRRGGKSVSLDDRDTPLVLELEIGDYEIDLSCADLPPQTVTLPAGKQKSGGTVTIIGDLRKPGSIQILQ